MGLHPSLSVAGVNCWQTCLLAKPVIHRWPDQYAVYNPLSGHTHLLDLVAGELLVAIDQQPQSTQSLSERVAATLDMPMDDTVRSQVDRMLEHLDDIGLIEPATRCASKTSP